MDTTKEIMDGLRRRQQSLGLTLEQVQKRVNFPVNDLLVIGSGDCKPTPLEIWLLDEALTALEREQRHVSANVPVLPAQWMPVDLGGGGELAQAQRLFADVYQSYQSLLERWVGVMRCLAAYEDRRGSVCPHCHVRCAVQRQHAEDCPIALARAEIASRPKPLLVDPAFTAMQGAISDGRLPDDISATRMTDIM